MWGDRRQVCDIKLESCKSYNPRGQAWGYSGGVETAVIFIKKSESIFGFKKESFKVLIKKQIYRCEYSSQTSRETERIGWRWSSREDVGGVSVDGGGVGVDVDGLGVDVGGVGIDIGGVGVDVGGIGVDIDGVGVV